MKKLATLIFIFGFLLPAHAATSFPEPVDSYINDYAEVLSTGDTTNIRAVLQQLRQQTGIEMTVVTIKNLSDYTDEFPFAKFAAKLFDHWGVGDKEKNNGILILFSENDREIRIEMGLGYNYRYDNALQDVVDNKMIPYLSNNEFSRGIYEGVFATIEVVTTQVSWWSYYKWRIAGGVLAFVCILAGISCFKNGKNGWGFAFFSIAAAIIIIIVKLADTKSEKSGGGGGHFGGGKSGGGGAGGRF